MDDMDRWPAAGLIDTILRGFLVMLWCQRALQGQTTQDAFFIRSSLFDMYQNDTDNGGLICEVGMALVKPGEFVAFRLQIPLRTSSVHGTAPTLR